MPVDEFHDEPSVGLSRNELSKRSRSLLVIFVVLLVPCLFYVWDGEVATEEIVEVVIQKPPIVNAPLSPIIEENIGPNTESPTKSPVENEHSSSSSASESPHTAPPLDNVASKSPTATPLIPNDDDNNLCSSVCQLSASKRKQKFGGDLLDPKDILRLANNSREDTIGSLREMYGEYFDPIFVNETKGEDEPNRYYGMKGMNPDGHQSRDRLKRKLKLKVLKMMTSIITTERSMHGCDCMQNSGIPTSGVDENRLVDLPNFYEKYVFANGGHSQAAGHGNKYSESYTAVFARDVRRVWEAIGIEFIDRNYAMGAMLANPYMSSCTKETFGVDVDFLAWNYGMTDGKPFSTAHYVYRGALSPGRPAIAILDSNRAQSLAPFEDMGISIFKHRLEGAPIAALPDGSPDGIPLSDSEVKKIPNCALNIKCTGRLEGKEVCFDGNVRWSCTQALKDAGSACVCPNVGKRSSWHMGYKMHALFGHLMALPFLEMMIEALKELAASTTDTETLLRELQGEENADYEEFLSKPLIDLLWGEEQYTVLGLPNETLFETWFKGPSICRSSYLPSESRYLGITTDSDKVGGPAILGQETYDIGFTVANIGSDGNYSFVGEDVPQPGVFSLLNNGIERSGWNNREAWGAECPELIMPDYKDFFYAPLLDGKASIIFPSEKEKAYYGYDPLNFKGIISLVLPLQVEPGCKECHSHDLALGEFTEGKVKVTINSKPVTTFRVVRKTAMILEGDGGNVYWEPDANGKNYKIEFEVAAEVAQYHLRLGTIILY